MTGSTQNIGAKTKCMVFLVLGCLLTCSATQLDASPQEKKKKTFKIVLTLNKSKLKALVTDGFIKAPIPQSYHNKITAIVLKHEDNVIDKRLKMDGDAAKLGSNLILPLSESVVERVKYQPLELKVYAKGYTSVILKFDGKLRTAAARQPSARPITRRPTTPRTQTRPQTTQSQTTQSQTTRPKNTSPVRPKTVNNNPKATNGSSTTRPVRPTQTLPKTVSNIGEPKVKKAVNEVDPKNYRYLRVSADKGTDIVIDLAAFPMETQFGKVAITLDTIDGILFDVDGDGTHLIQLKNGDRIKGKSELEEIPVYSRWGNDKLKIGEVHSITPSRLQRFQEQKATEEGELDRWFIKY